MKKKLSLRGPWFLGALVVSVLFLSAWSYQTFKVSGTTIYDLDNSGNLTLAGTLTTTGSITSSGSLLVNDPIKLGYGESTITTANAAQMGVKVPFIANDAMVQGNVVIASSPVTGVQATAYGAITAVLSTTSVVGVCDGTVAAGALGWMTVSGYALVLTTGTVLPGDLLVSTDGVNAAGAAGYAGKVTPAAGVVVGTIIGKAMTSGTASGGLTVVRLGE